MSRSGRSGFTLIELLVVIAIIAILAAILFPVFANSKERSRMATCTSNLKNLSLAVRAYADDNSGKTPSAHAAWQSPSWIGLQGTGDPALDVRTGSIWRYTGKNKSIYCCPTDSKTGPSSVTGQPKGYPSYSINWQVGTVPTHPQCERRPRVTIDTVRSPTKVLLFIHEGRDKIDDGCFYWFAGGDDTRNMPSKCHYNGTTASYLDGHAGWLGYSAFIKARDNVVSKPWDPDPSPPRTP